GFPGFREVVAEEPEAGRRQLPVDALRRRPVFADAGPVADVPPGTLRATVIADVPVLLVNVEREVYAFRNGCPVGHLPIEGGRLTGAVLVCPWHNCAYDARTGARVDDEGGPPLRPIPIAVDEGAVRVAVNVG